MDKKKDKRELIIKASMKLFCRDGFHKSKVSEIATEAGVGKGTIYEYFDHKKHLFEEMIKYCADIHFENLVKQVDAEEHIIDKFRRYIALEEETMIKHGDLAQLFIREAQTNGLDFHKIMGKRRQQKVDFFVRLIQEGIDSGIFRKVNPYTAALTLMGSVHHILISKIFLKDHFCEKVNINDLQDLLLNGLKK